MAPARKQKDKGQPKEGAKKSAESTSPSKPDDGATTLSSLPPALQHVNASHYTDLQAALAVIREDPFFKNIDKVKPLPVQEGGCAVHSSMCVY